MKRRENNTGTIYRQKGARSKPYIVRVATGEKGMTPSGRVYYKTTTIGCYSTYDEAEYALAVYKKDPTQTKEGYFTVNDVWEQYEKAMESRLAPVTLKMYQSAYKKLKPIADRNIAKLEVQECQQLLDGIESIAARGKAKILISNLLDYCPVLNITPRQVAKNLYVPTKKAKAKSVFTNEELSRLWEADPSIYSRAILIMIYSGMRIGELFQLRPEQVHLDDRYLVGGEKTEAGRDRTIPIRQEIVPLLADFLDNKGGSNTTASFTARVGGYLDAIGMDHTSHEARHTFISFAIQSQIPLPTIQQIVGHASGSVTTSVYTHIPTRELIKAVDSISFVW